MKLSLAWIFDHIDSSLKKIDVAALAHTFNLTTAQIETTTKVSFDVSDFTLAQLTAFDTVTVTLHSSEWNTSITLPAHKELVSSHWYLIKKEGTTFRWAMVDDLGGNKHEYLPSIHCAPEEYAGSWKKKIEQEDYILEVDNNSISHRPDLWGHRGIAREVAAMLNLPLKPIEKLAADYPIIQADSSFKATADNPFTITNAAPTACKRFAGLFIHDITLQGTPLWMVLRLCRVEAKPISLLVDLTNYIMLDLGQPLHAFDAHYITNKTVAPRMAQKGEKITLLDGQTIELQSTDLVIADGKQPLALAGIMGGASSAVHEKTTSIFVEAACFDSGTIRQTATLHKKRTDASVRFEKSVDPNGNTIALERLLQLAKHDALTMSPAPEIISLGAPAKQGIVNITHDYLEKHIGVSIDPSFVTSILQKLGFEVIMGNGNNYVITVPSYRLRDVQIAEDIIEEIVRYFGYNKIPHNLPSAQLSPSDLKPVTRMRAIKECMAYSLRMREIETCALFDEVFLRKLSWEPVASPAMKNALSEHYYRLVTSLVPHLIKAVDENCADHEQLRFFEFGRIWKEEQEIIEKKALAGIIYNKKMPIDFYSAKDLLSQLFNLLELDIKWHRVDAPEQPWYAEHQTAKLIHEGTVIGMAGLANSTFLHRITQGNAFVFELDGEYLLSYLQPLKRFKPLPKYPAVTRDISMLIPLRYTVDEIVTQLSACDPLIKNIALVDFFTKKEWLDRRSITIRCTLRNDTATMTSQEADTIMAKAIASLQKLGAEIR